MESAPLDEMNPTKKPVLTPHRNSILPGRRALNYSQALRRGTHLLLLEVVRCPVVGNPRLQRDHGSPL